MTDNHPLTCIITVELSTGKHLNLSESFSCSDSYVFMVWNSLLSRDYLPCYSFSHDVDVFFWILGDLWKQRFYLPMAIGAWECSLKLQETNEMAEICWETRHAHAAVWGKIMPIQSSGSKESAKLLPWQVSLRKYNEVSIIVLPGSKIKTRSEIEYKCYGESICIAGYIGGVKGEPLENIFGKVCRDTKYTPYFC